MKNNSTFTFNLEWAEALEGFDAATQGAVYYAIVHYVRTGQVPTIPDPVARVAFNFIRRELDRALRRKAALAEKRRHAALRQPEAPQSEVAETPAEAEPDPESKPKECPPAQSRRGKTQPSFPAPAGKRGWSTVGARVRARQALPPKLPFRAHRCR